jgi:hypothetical protein
MMNIFFGFLIQIEPGYSVGTATRMTEELRFDFWQAQEVLFFLAASRPSLEPKTASYPVGTGGKATEA